jgi:hypothetical protein
VSTTKNEQPPAIAPHLDLPSASRITIEWWDEHAMLDAINPAQRDDEHEHVLSVAEALGLRTVRDLHERAAEVISLATGLHHLTQFYGPEDAEHLHRIRNAIAAIVFASEVHASSEPRPYDLVQNLPPITPRPGTKRRSLRDDEVLLTRSGATYWFAGGGRQCP